MSEAVELAKVARANLAAALNALQASEGVPEALFDLAEPIAKVMGILHRVERSNGAVLEGRDVALEEVRQLLSKLQHVDTQHPVLETVMEMVAASLSKVHSLARYVPPAAAPLPPPPQVAFQPLAGLGSTEPLRASPFATGATVPGGPGVAPQAVPAPAPQPVAATPYAPQPAPMQTVPMPQVASPQPVHRPASAPPQPAYAPTQPNPPQAPYAPPPPAQPAYAPPVAPPPAYVAPPPAPQPAYAPPQAQQPAYVAPPPAQAAAVSRGPAPAATKGGPLLDVSLGTHSASNFYKGLGGNDVIEHGGLFIATYKVLKIGTPIELRVMLPGDYEFTASAVVQWSREASAGEAEPGYGARFTHITPEGRQLVYRYTRNREPLFYDDL